jgi:hypothetical protein
MKAMSGDRDPLALHLAGHDGGGVVTAGDDRLARGEVLQVGGQRGGRRVAAGRLLLEAFEQDGLEIRGHRGVQRRGRRHVLVDDHAQRLDGIRALEGGQAGEDLVEHGAERVDVALLADLRDLARGLLGRHIARGADDGARHGDLRMALQRLGEAEVHDVGLAVLVEHDVVGLDVAVDDAARVGVLDGAGDLREDGGGLGGGELLAREAAAVDELHRDHVLVADVADLVDADDARVAQRGGGLSLAAEADELLLAAGAEEDLEGDPAAQGAFPRLIDHAHAAAAELLDEDVLAEEVLRALLGGGDLLGQVVRQLARREQRARALLAEVFLLRVEVEDGILRAAGGAGEHGLAVLRLEGLLDGAEAHVALLHQDFAEPRGGAALVREVLLDGERLDHLLLRAVAGVDEDLAQGGVVPPHDGERGVAGEDAGDFLAEGVHLLRGDEAPGDEHVGETGLGAVGGRGVHRRGDVAEAVDELVTADPAAFDTHLADDGFKGYGHDGTPLVRSRAGLPPGTTTLDGISGSRYT